MSSCQKRCCDDAPACATLRAARPAACARLRARGCPTARAPADRCRTTAHLVAQLKRRAGPIGPAPQQRAAAGTDARPPIRPAAPTPSPTRARARAPPPCPRAHGRPQQRKAAAGARSTAPAREEQGRGKHAPVALQPCRAAARSQRHMELIPSPDEGRDSHDAAVEGRA